MSTLAAAARERVVVLDGGLATELEAQGEDLSSALWSARLLTDDPDAIYRAHRAFFEAGAEVATTSSYQVSAQGFAPLGLTTADVTELLRRSVTLAARAREDAAPGPAWIAASVGPYGAVLADGSEYRGDYGIGVAELREFHRPRLNALAAAGADVLAVETIPCLAEIEALALELELLDVPAWMSLTCAHGTTRAGEPLAEAFAIAAAPPAVFAVGVNCTDPAEVGALLHAAAGVTDKALVAYPNSGETWDAAARGWIGDSRFTADQVDGWVGAGARLVGGCCRVSPADVHAVSALLGRRD